MGQTPASTDSLGQLDAKTAAVIAAARRAEAKLQAGAAITSVELAAITGLNPNTVTREATAGRYPHQTPTGPGGAVRFSPDDVKAIRAAIARPARTVPA